MVNAYSGGALGHVGIALSFAFVVTVMIYTLGHIASAHINPAMTVAFASARRIPRCDVLPCVAAQRAGSVLASVLARLALGPVGGLGATRAVPSLPVGAAFGVGWGVVVRGDAGGDGGCHRRARGGRLWRGSLWG